MPPDTPNPTRREFLTLAGALTAFAAAGATIPSPAPRPPSSSIAPLPWYRRTYRWGQTNITEIDPPRYDIPWWREHWKRTEVQGLIINAGGIVAYYPTQIPGHYRAAQLNDRDLFGDLTKAAHDDGLTVFARMDTRGGQEPLYRAHPDWFAVDAQGKPYRSGDFYLACINGPYFDEFVPSIFREIVSRSHPEGFTDNSWSGPGRNSICYCPNCAARFRDYAKKELPTRSDWTDQTYRLWIQWNYARRIELWEFNNRITRDVGGPDCLWVGMNGIGSWQSANFRDLKEICARTPIVMLDLQNRADTSGLYENALAGNLVHNLLGWDKLIPESMAMYQNARSVFRFTAKSAPEAQLWMLSGIAGGIQPWWHHVGAYNEDRRMYQTAEPICRWHKANQEYLIDRRPLACVALVWSQRNTDFFGRDNPDELVEQPWRGFAHALVRARIPFVPLHIDHLDRDAENFSLVILSNIGALSDDQIASIRRFVEKGGSLIATGQTGLFDQWGEPRPDFALADLFGVKGAKPAPSRSATSALHTYLRLTPELRAQFYGPKTGDEPAVISRRHPILAGFDETDILPFGGSLENLDVDPAATVLLTYVPPFPVMPPEFVYPRQSRTAIPGLVVREIGKSRIAFLPADIDRRFAIDNLPDHGNLLANIVRWAARENIPLEIQGPGFLDCHLYRQPNRLILHLVNLTNPAAWRAPVNEFLPIGPLNISVQPPADLQIKTCRALVSDTSIEFAKTNNAIAFELKSLLHHEFIILSS